MLLIQGLHAGYDGVPVVRDLDLAVSAGEVVAVLGPNGSGKTTTLLTISGLLASLGGSVQVDGQRINKQSVHAIARSGVALVPEGRALIPSLTVEENLRIVRQTSIDPLEWFPELMRLLRRRAGLLSGGEQQMLALARAIAGGPKVLMVDELSLGLAPVVVRSLLQHLRQFASETGAAILIVEQHVRQALLMSDRAYVLGRGRLVQTGPSSELLNRPGVLASSYMART
jgi:branched-chain amino acid transport system ATP-binding protein